MATIFPTALPRSEPKRRHPGLLKVLLAAKGRPWHSEGMAGETKLEPKTVYFDPANRRLEFVDGDRLVEVVFSSRRHCWSWRFVSAVAVAQYLCAKYPPPKGWEGVNAGFVKKVLQDSMEWEHATIENCCKYWKDYGYGTDGQRGVTISRFVNGTVDREQDAVMLFAQGNNCIFLGTRKADEPFWKITFQSRPLTEIVESVVRFYHIPYSGNVMPLIEIVSTADGPNQSEMNPTVAVDPLDEPLQRYALNVQSWLGPSLGLASPLGGPHKSIYIERHLVCGRTPDHEPAPVEDHGAGEAGSIPAEAQLGQRDLLQRILDGRRKVCIVGDAGAGKSTLLRKWALELAGNLLQQSAPEKRWVPFYIRLRDWNPDRHRELEDLLHDQGSELDRPLVKQLMENGKAVLLLDGADERAGGGWNRRTFLEWLDRQVSRSGVASCPVVAAGRPWAFDWALIPHFCGERWALRELEGREVGGYVKGYLGRADQARALLRQVQNSRVARAFCRRPLLLMLLCSASKEKRIALPSSEGELLELAMRELLHRRRLRQEASLHLLGALAWASWIQGREPLTERRAVKLVVQAMKDDRVLQQLWGKTPPDTVLQRLARQGGVLTYTKAVYAFPDDTFVEYLAGRHIAAQPPAVVQKLFARHAWNPVWQRILLFAVGEMWSDRRGLARAIVRRLLDEVHAGRDDLWHSLAFLSARCVGSAHLPCDGEEQKLLDEVVQQAFAGWQFVAVSRYRKESLDWSDQAVLSLAALAPGDVTTRLLAVLEDPQLGKRAAEVLAALPSEELTEELIRRLDIQKDVGTREAIVHTLTAAPRNPKVLDALKKAMHDPEPIVRSAAAKALGEVGGDEDLEDLRLGLADESPSVQLSAIAAIGQLPASDKKAASLEQALLAPDPLVRSAAADQLAACRTPRAMQILAIALYNGSPEIRKLAARTLGESKGHEAASALMGALRNGCEEVREEAANALGQIADAGTTKVLIESLKDGVEAVRAAAAESLGLIWKDAPDGEHVRQVVNSLATAMKIGPAELRCSAIRALGRIGLKQAAQAVIDAVEADEKEVQREAALALLPLSNWDYDLAAETLVKAMSGGCPAVRAHARWLLGWLGAKGNAALRETFEEGICQKYQRAVVERAVPALTEASNSPNKTVVLEAARSLGALGTDEAVETLAGLLDSADEQIVTRAVASLGLAGTPAAVKSLTEFASGAEGAALRRAVEHLARIGSNVARKVFLRFSHSRDHELRQAAVWGLARISSASDESALLKAMHDRHPSVRGCAVGGLGRLLSPGAAKGLVRALGDPEVPVRAEAVKACAQRPYPCAIHQLIGMLTKEEHGPIRRHAAEALGLIGSEAASTALLQVLITPGYPTVKAAGRAKSISEPGMTAAEFVQLHEARELADAAAKALARIGTEGVLLALMRVHDTAENEETRFSSLRGLWQIRTGMSASAFAQAALAGHHWAGHLLDEWCMEKVMTVFPSGRTEKLADLSLSPKALTSGTM